MSATEHGSVGPVDYRVRRVRRLWQAEIRRQGEDWQLAVTPSGNKEQQLDAAIRCAIYATRN